jgi:hypothetical protein
VDWADRVELKKGETNLLAVFGLLEECKMGVGGDVRMRGVRKIE